MMTECRGLHNRQLASATTENEIDRPENELSSASPPSPRCTSSHLFVGIGFSIVYFS